MSREIKFRAWDKEKKVMRELGSIQIDMQPFGITKKTFFEFKGIESGEMVVGDIVEKFVLRQFTGLKDKNGKELYFDDLVKIIGSEKIWHVTKDDFGIPVFIRPGIIITFEKYFLNDPSRHRNDFEIIGNVYENTELLN